MNESAPESSEFLICGDIHGHLQLVLSVAALWQRSHRRVLAGIFLCGDVGTLTDETEIDNATRAHARTDPAELEFLNQWSANPPAPWLAEYFVPEEDGGLGIVCPIVMVHGNHEGFRKLAALHPNRIPELPVSIEALPTVDSGGRIRWLPSGWRTVGPGGRIFAGLGGIERGQRTAQYHDLAYIDQDAATELCSLEPGAVDVLLTHQGPASTQGRQGSETLDVLLETRVAKHCFHGHSTRHDEFKTVHDTKVFPLPDAHKCFRERPRSGFGWCQWQNDELRVARQLPEFIRELRPKKWRRTKEGLMVRPLATPSSVVI
ncbi:MAG: metallophosphoesterase [Myxococcota bacterium]